MNLQPLLKSFPIIAATLAAKNGMTVQFGEFETASTNGKIIRMPNLPDSQDALLLGRGYIDHECAHGRFTDFGVPMGRGLRKGLFNVLEDIRIEKGMIAQYPGSAKNLYDLEAYLVKTTYKETTTSSHPAEILFNTIHHTLRVDVLGQSCTSTIATLAQACMAEAFSEELVAGIYGCLAEVPNLQSTQEAADLADKILALFENEQEQNDQSSDSSEQEEGERGDASEEADSEQSQSEDGGSEENDDNSDGENQDQDSGKEGSAGGDSQPSEDDPECNSGSESGEGEEPTEPSCSPNAISESKTDSDGENGSYENNDGDTAPQANQNDQQGSKHRENCKALVDAMIDPQYEDTDRSDAISEAIESEVRGNTSGSTLGAMPAVRQGVSNWRSFADPLATRRASGALQTRLRGLLESSSRSLTRQARTGSRLNSSMLASVATGEDRVFQRREQKRGLMTRVDLVLDLSNSMANRKIDRIAVESCLAVSQALYGLKGVKCSVTGFSSETDLNGNEMPIVIPMLQPGERPVKEKFPVKSYRYTPLAEALWWAALNLVQDRSVDRHLLLVITDGDADDPSRVIQVAKKLEASGTELYAVGINHAINKALFSENTTIRSVDDLATALFGVLRKKLVA